MLTLTKLPWPKIHDFLLEAGSQRRVQDLTTTVIERIGELIPYDCGAAWFEAKPGTPLRCYQTKGIAERFVMEHNNYYNRFTPPVLDKVFRNVGFVDWRCLRHTEYAREFIFPQGIRYAGGFLLWDNRGESFLCLTLTHSKYDYEQHLQVRKILEIIQSHLSNYYSYLNLLSAQDNSYIHLAELAADCRILSKREAEIAGLLCRRLSVPEISSILLISPKTTYRHVANIYEKMGVNNRKGLILKITGKEDGFPSEE